MNPVPNPAPVFDAFRMAGARSLLPTALGTAELRDLGAGILSRSVFTARGTSAIYLSMIKEVVGELTAGNIGEADARVTLLETLKALGYTPERGFPDVPEGTVPPAIKGTLQDFGSFRRLDLVVRTQTDLMRGAGFQFRGHSPDRLEAAPAWELIRVMNKAVPRDWKARWAIAGGVLYGENPAAAKADKDGEIIFRLPFRMIALKGDPVWGELGSSGNFDDALDTDHPPFAFTSGMGWREIPRAECIALGVVGPDGQSIEEFHQGFERPRVIAGELPLPSPSLSMKDVDPDLLKQFEDETKAVPSKAPGVFDYSDLLEEALADRAKEYAERGAK